MRRQLARILLVGSMATAGDLGAAEPISQLPKGQELILEAASFTGCSDYLYSVPAGRYPANQMEWLRKIHRFRFGDTFDYPVEFLDLVPNPLTRSELTALLGEGAFAAWAGPQLIGALRALAEARAALMASASQLPRGEAFFEHPAVGRYLKADLALGKQLETQFKVIATDVAPNCD